MPTKRSGGAAAVLDGKIYVAGGRTSQTGNHFAVYDPKADKWEALPPAPTQRNHLGVVAAAGKIWVVGGRYQPSFRAEQSDKLEAYDPRTGRELGGARGTPVEVIPTPVVGHGLVFCTSGRAGPTLAIRPGGSGDVTDTHIVWKAPKGSPFVPAPIIVGDHLFMINDMMSVATIYDARSGEVTSQGRLGRASRESFSGAPVTIDGRVFFTNDDGDTFVLEAGPEVEILHVNRLGERTLASPALVDGRWYFRTARHLLAIGSG